MHQIKYVIILLLFSLFCCSFSYNHIKKHKTVNHPNRNIKITIVSILCKDPHDNSGGVFDPDLNTEDNIYLHINQPSYDRIPKHPVTGQPLLYKIKKNQVRGPDILWEGEILDNESFDVSIWLRNNNRLELGRFSFKLQNKHGYVLVDWKERKGGNKVSYSTNRGGGRNIRGESKIINTIRYPGTRTTARYSAPYYFYDKEGDDDANLEDDLEEYSRYEVTIRVEVF